VNYSQTLDYLYAQLPMFTRIGAAAFKKDLTNTIALCNVLDNPQERFNSIHIAGTNGKGSTSHLLASILQEAGYNVGLYTSPHLKDFRERVRVNGNMIPEQTVVDFVEQYKTSFDTIQPSFFEWTVALAFNYFAQQQVDIAIIETGLGGRLDSTNIITPLLSVITNIGWDHMDMLGDNLPQIAGEKAGIIKQGIPVVIGEYQPDLFDVFEQKAQLEASALIVAEKQITLQSFANNNLQSSFDILLDGQDWMQQVECGLPGNYQQKNIPTVLAAIIEIRKQGFNISETQLRSGLKNVRTNTGLSGRWQVLSQQPLTICDTGHNVNGMQYVLEQINQTPHQQLHMVMGMVRDKDISKVLSILPKNAVYYFCNAAIPRALPAHELKTMAQPFGLNGAHYISVKEALAAAQEQAQLNDLIFIGGSTFVVAEVV
jgi:dihydrofolate synthase / folylpolyglutamate synthase